MDGTRSTIWRYKYCLIGATALAMSACSGPHPSYNYSNQHNATQHYAQNQNYRYHAPPNLRGSNARYGHQNQNDCATQMLVYSVVSQNCHVPSHRYQQPHTQQAYNSPAYSYNAPAHYGSPELREVNPRYAEPTVNSAYFPAANNQNSTALFQTHSLSNSLRQTVGTHPGLVSERLRVKTANEGYMQARAAGLPTIELLGSVGVRDSTTVYEIGTAGSNNITRSTSSVEARLSQPIYQGGKVKALKKSARAQINAAQAQLKSAETDILLRTAETYFEIIRNRKALEIYASSVTSLQDQLRISDQLLQHGEGTISEKALVNSRLTSAQMQFTQAQSRLETTESQYHLLVGHQPGNLLHMRPLVPPQSLTEAKALAQANNPKILGAMHALEVANQNVTIAKTESSPSVSLDGAVRGSTGQSETIKRNTAVELALKLRVPIYSGGQKKSEVRQAKIARSIALQDVRTATMEVEQMIFQTWRDLEAANQSVFLSEAQIQASREAYESVKIGKQAGVSSISDVLLAEQGLRDAMLGLIDGENQQQLQTMKLLAEIGSLGADSFLIHSEPLMVSSSSSAFPQTHQ